MTLEGIFGTAVDVSSSLIILFTIYGAFLQFSGAGKFFIDFSFSAMGGKPTSAGRTVVLASFLLGGPSGSGVATTVTLGAVAYPMLAKVGYEQERSRRPARRGRPGRDHLAAGAGRGGVPDRRVPQDLVPRRDADGDDPDLPVLPRAVPHGRDRRAQVRHERRRRSSKVESLWSLTQNYWFHFLSLVSIVVFMLLGFLAGAVGVLGDRGGVRHQLPAPRLRADLLRPVPRQGLAGRGPVPARASSRRWKAARSACSTSRPPAPAPASSSAW